MECPLCGIDNPSSTRRCNCGYLFRRKESLPAPQELVQKKQFGRGVSLVSGCLVTILAVFWWYQSSQPPGGSQVRVHEELTGGEIEQAEPNESGNSLPIVPRAVPRDPQSADPQTTLSQISEDQPAPAARPTDLPESSVPDSYTIQVGAFRSQGAAQMMLSQLSAKGHPGRIEQRETDRYYHVWVGEFTSREEASQFQTRLKTDGFETYIRKIVDQ